MKRGSLYYALLARTNEAIAVVVEAFPGYRVGDFVLARKSDSKFHVKLPLTMSQLREADKRGTGDTSWLDVADIAADSLVIVLGENQEMYSELECWPEYFERLKKKIVGAKT